MAVRFVRSEFSGMVRKVAVVPGQVLREGDVIVALESMKMDIPVLSERDGEVIEVLVAEGDGVAPGTALAQVEW